MGQYNTRALTATAQQGADPKLHTSVTFTYKDKSVSLSKRSKQVARVWINGQERPFKQIDDTHVLVDGQVFDVY